MIGLGQRLTHARKLKRITLEQAAKALRIRTEFLEAIETGEYKKLPSAAYATGFVGNYAQYLGLSKSETVAMFRREYDEKREYAVLPNEFTKTKEFNVKRFHFQQTFGIFALIAFCIIGYMAFQYRFFFFSPTLEVYTPKENEVFQTNEVFISGKTDPNATVTVNNNIVTVNPDGDFSKQVSVFAGKTIVTISSENRFGKKTVIHRNIDVQLEQ